MSLGLSPWLDTLDSSKIEDLRIDLEDNKISFQLAPSMNSGVSLEFEGVSAFYYIDGSDTALTADHRQDRIHSISYHKGGFGEFASVRPFEDHSYNGPIEISIPNFAISLDDSSMYIEAKSININGNQFDVTRKI